MRQLSVTYLSVQRLRSGLLFWAAVSSGIGFAIILVVVAMLILSAGAIRPCSIPEVRYEEVA